jgi:type I restriction enzyme S subunit
MMVSGIREPTVFESNMMRLRLKEAILPEFLIHVLQSRSIRQQIQTRAKPAVNQASINQTDVRRFWIPLPKLEEQSAIARILADHRALREALRRRLSLLVTLRNGLVQDLLTGKTHVFAKVEATGT